MITILRDFKYYRRRAFNKISSNNNIESSWRNRFRYVATHRSESVKDDASSIIEHYWDGCYRIPPIWVQTDYYHNQMSDCRLNAYPNYKNR